MTLLSLKARAAAAIRDRAATLIDLSRRIHAAPELGYQEHQASRWVGDVLADGGFDVRRAVCDLPRR
jgi:metal-dependent amidase/aminoacylase/carboxypeptidase family protein